MKNTDFVKYIKKAGKTERTKEFEYADGFFVKLAYASRFIWNQVREDGRDIKPITRGRSGEEQFNEPKLRKAYALRVIQGWRGLTVEKMDALIPGFFDVAKAGILEQDQTKTDEEIGETEVEYDEETAFTLVDNSMDFDNWVFDVSRDTEKFQNVAERKKKEYENLESLQKEV